MTTSFLLLLLLSFVFVSCFHVFRHSTFRRALKSSIVLGAYVLLSICEMGCWNLTSFVFEFHNAPSEFLSGVTVTFNFNMKCKLVTPGNSMR